MRTRSFVTLTPIVATLTAAIACSSSSSSGGVSPQGDGGVVQDSGPHIDAADAATSHDGSSPGDASAPTAQVRVAHLSPDAPAVDFCLAAHGTTTFAGPVLKGAGNAAGLSYPNVTAYLSVPAKQYDVRIVAPNAADCTTPLAGLPDFTSLPALSAGGSFTVAAEGQVTAGGTPFALTAYVDDSTVTSGKAALRFVHASPGTPAVDVGTGAGATFAAVFTDVAYAATSSGSSVDANGYLVTPPLSGVELSARAHGTTTDALVIPSATLPAGAIATAFAIGELGSTTKPLSVLLCVDNGTPSGGLSNCTVVGDSLAHVRVAHLSPDAPAVDVCVKAQSAASWPAKPLLESLGVAAGLSYPQVTTYVPLPVDSYDVRIVAPGAADCSTALASIPDTNGVQVAAGLHATVAATGDVTPAGHDPSFALKVFVDETGAPAGDVNVRFIHASPGTPAVDVGLVSGATFTPLFKDVAFGTAAAAGGGVDADGYLAAAPLSGVTIGAAATGTTTVVKSVSGLSLPAGAVVSAFAIGGKTGATANPLQVLLCTDSAAPTGLLTSCAAM